MSGDGIGSSERGVTGPREHDVQPCESERRYRRLVETSPGPIFVYAMDGELIYANEAAVEFLGADDRDELIGTTAGSFTHPDDEEFVDRRYRRLTEEREPVPPIEETLVDADGEVKHAILASTPVIYGGEPVIQTVATDITEQKRRERELQRQNEHLEEFAGILSHDLRNPLSVATGHLELARDDCSSDHLDTVGTALDRIGGIIDDTLALVEVGQGIEQTSRLTLADVVRRSWQNVTTDDAEIAVEAGMTFVADEGRVRHLFENLFRNAVEHGGSDVTVRVGTLDDGFYVEDDGPGIPEDEREDVFEAGYSADDGGTGFGLSIVDRVAEAHGWDVAVIDGSVGGARFEITDIDSIAEDGD